MGVIIPLIFLGVMGFALFKRVKIYDEFTAGVGEGARFTLSVLPCLAAVFMMCELFESSGLSAMLERTLAPVFSAFGIPKELTKLTLMKPFSGSGSLALLTEIIKKYGADSYIARCASVCFGSSETAFYISAVYFAGLKKKRLAIPLIIVLFSGFLATVLGCQLCKFM